MATAKKNILRKAPVKKTPAKAAKVKNPSADKSARLSIRMYRHGLGDCLLLRFARESGGTFNVLIDCGIIMVATDAKKRMGKVVKDIAKACGGRLDVVVMTHEHWDHASGFSTQHAQDLFDVIEIGEVWYGWTEDPQNELGVRLRNERAEKVKALAMASQAMEKFPAMSVRARGLNSILGFFGFKP